MNTKYIVFIVHMQKFKKKHSNEFEVIIGKNDGRQFFLLKKGSLVKTPILSLLNRKFEIYHHS